jgi:hypothetical protein
MIVRNVQMHESIIDAVRFEPFDELTLDIVQHLYDQMLGVRINIMGWARPDTGDPVIQVGFDNEDDFMLFYMRHG